VPDPVELTELDLDLLHTVEDGFRSVGDELEAVHLRAALAEAMRIASEVNKYLDQTAPWQAVKTDRQAAARAIFTAIKAIDSLKTLFAPFLPFTSERLHGFLGYESPLFGTQKPPVGRMPWAGTKCWNTMPPLQRVPGIAQPTGNQAGHW